MKKIITIVKDLFRYFQIPQKEKNLTLFIEKISDINYFNRFLIDLYKSLDLKVVILTSQIIEDKKSPLIIDILKGLGLVAVGFIVGSL